MRVFTAALWNETNPFAPFPLDITAFEENGLWGPGERPDGETEGASVCEEARRRAKAGLRLPLHGDGRCAQLRAAHD